jgi:hypothetical protein
MAQVHFGGGALADITAQQQHRPRAVKLRGEGSVVPKRQGRECLGDAILCVGMSTGERVRVRGDAVMERLESAGADLARLAQARLDLVETRRRALLRQGPAQMDRAPGVPQRQDHLVGEA